jgi:hypothetical protein
VTGAEAFFERLTPPRAVDLSPRRRGAAIEIGVDELQFLELSPQGGRLLASRFATVALAGVKKDLATTTRMAIVASGLEVLRERVGGSFPPCTVLWDHGSTQAEVLMVHPSTRRIQRVVNRTLGRPGGEGGTVSHLRDLGKVRVGNQLWKSVLATRDETGELERVKAVLDAARVPVVRIATSSLVFLETVVPLLARSDEDAAEVFLFLEPRKLTLALVVRAEILTSRSYPIEPGLASFGYPVFQMQFLGHLKQAAKEFQTALEGGSIARVRYMSTLVDKTPFPAKDVAAKLGCVPEIIDAELDFKVDPESLDAKLVLARVRTALVPAAFEATLAPVESIDLGAPEARVVSARRLFWIANALLAVTIVLALSTLGQHPPDDVKKELDAVAARREELAIVESLIAERADVLALAERAREVARDERVVRDATSPSPDLRAAFAALGRVKPAEVFYERVSFSKEARTGRWAVDLAAVATGERAAEASRELVLGLRTSGGLEGVSSQPGLEKPRPGEVRVEVHATLTRGAR